MAKKKKLAQADVDMDLTPMIDVIFLLIIFFILAGKITADITNENIVVPPTKTAEKFEKMDDWRVLKVEVWGNTQDPTGDSRPGHAIKVGLNPTMYASGSTGEEAFKAYQGLRESLNDVYDRAEKYPDPKGTPLQLPKVIIELRADADTEYRVVQEIQQVATDTVSPYADKNGNYMQPNTPPGGPAGAKPFVLFHYTTRKPGE